MVWLSPLYKYECSGQYMHDTHSINAAKVGSATENGSTEVVSDHTINACECLNVHIANLLTMVLRHGLSPDGMLHSTMVPIPKRRWANLSSSDNFKAITLSNSFCKLLDVLVMTKEKDNLCTSNLQFSFKPGASTSLRTGMVQETISHYVNNELYVYGLLFDASNAFDRVNYCKLFMTSLDRNIYALYCRLPLNMYINQKLKIMWETTDSSYFNVTNCVKQGGAKLFLQFCFVFTWMVY